MTDPVGSSTRVVTVGALLGALAFAFLLPATADAQTVQAYTCADSAQSGATSASLSLTNPPASVTAGGSVTLQADLTLTLPQSFNLAARASLVSQVGLSTTTFGLQVQIGSTVQVVPAAIVVGQLQTLGASEIASAALTFPAVNVPRTASGELVVSMPTAAQYPNSVTGTPAEVVFNGVVEQENYLGSPSSSNLACFDSSSSTPTSQVVAQIPIQAATATTKATAPAKTTTSTKPETTTTATQTKTTASSSAKSTHHSSTPAPASVPTAGPASQSATGAPVTGTPTASSVPAASTSGAPSASSSSAPTSASSSSGATAPAATEASASVTIPPRTVGRGTFIPTWELILMGSVVPIATLGYAWQTRRKLRAARTDLEHGSALLHGDGSALPHPDRSAPPEAETAEFHPAHPSATRESQTRT